MKSSANQFLTFDRKGGITMRIHQLFIYLKKGCMIQLGGKYYTTFSLCFWEPTELIRLNQVCLNEMYEK
jgi:hypothetical protein